MRSQPHAVQYARQNDIFSGYPHKQSIDAVKLKNQDTKLLLFLNDNLIYNKYLKEIFM